MPPYKKAERTSSFYNFVHPYTLTLQIGINTVISVIILKGKQILITTYSSLSIRILNQDMTIFVCIVC